MTEFYGTDDDDHMFHSGENSIIYGLAGNDGIYSGTNAQVITYGGDGDDYISGSSGANTLHGDAGFDTINAGSGNDLIYGGDNSDELDGRNGSDTIFGGGGGDLIRANSVFSEGDVDVFYGGDGSDVFIASADEGSTESPVAILYGGAGNDRFVIDSVDDIVVEGQGEGTDRIHAYGMSIDLSNYANIESASLEGDRLSLVGTDDSNYLEIEGSNSTIHGANGNDTIRADVSGIVFGGMGDDEIRTSGYVSIYGGLGDDTIAASTDTYLIYAGDGDDIIKHQGFPWSLNKVRQIYAGSGDDDIFSDFPSDVYGGAGNDKIIIDPGVNGQASLFGGSGDDYLIGHQIELASGGAGNDIYRVDFSVVRERAGGGYDIVISDGNFTAKFGVEIEEYRLERFALDGRITGSARNEKIIGGIYIDGLNGGAGNDTIVGDPAGDGASDYISGGLGADRLIGGLGEDQFKLHDARESSREFGFDVIVDFDSRGDKILLSNMDGGRFVGGNAFSGSINEVRYNRATGWIEGDMNGDGTADWKIKLLNRPALQSDDFQFGFF